LTGADLAGFHGDSGTPDFSLPMFLKMPKQALECFIIDYLASLFYPEYQNIAIVLKPKISFFRLMYILADKMICFMYLKYLVFSFLSL